VAYLKVIKGSYPREILELAGERTVLGRHPHCEVVLDDVSVSRHHAQILESHGRYYLEDLRSRNRTYLNEATIEGRTELDDLDTIKVCDVHFRFHLQMPANDVSPMPKTHERMDALTIPERSMDGSTGDIEDSSLIIGTVSAKDGSNWRLDVKPEAKLRAVLEISQAVGNTLNVDEVLQKTLDGLFKIYPQADGGFVLLHDPGTRKVIAKATKFRGNQHEDSIRISTTIVNQAVETRDAILSADAVEDSQFELSDSLLELQIHSMMCVPLVGKSQDNVFGVIQIDNRNVKQKFSQDDLDMLVSVASQVSLAVENVRLHEEILRESLKKREMERDLEFATQIQLGFLPNQPPKLPGYEFFDFYESALSVGGDYFDYINLPDGRVAVAVGDVAGKGVSAALLMARLYSSARFHLLTQPTVADAMAGLNADVASSGLGHRFITFIIAILDPDTHQVTIGNAGHLPPIWRKVDGEVQFVGQQDSGMPLGIKPNQVFTEMKSTLQPEETLLLYTDGITEAMNPHEELYGRKRLSRYISGGPTGVEELVNGIIGDVETFCGEQSLRDDVCLVCLQRFR